MPQFNPKPMFLGSILSLSMGAQSKKDGPILLDFGEVWTINAPDFTTDGSSAMYRGIAQKETMDGVPISHTAMTTIIQFINYDYNRIKF